MNLSECVIRAEDTLETLKRKVRIATILGTLQATLTDFRYLRPIWKRNTEEECLLGVSLTGIMDHPLLSGQVAFIEENGKHYDLETVLTIMKEVAIETNKEWAARLGINPSTAICCVKPSGTVSQLTNSASGIHPRFSPYYIRTVRADKKDPLSDFLKAQGVPCEDDVMKPSNLVFSFPQKSPEGAICTKEVGAMDQLKLWKVYQDYWCEHKPSITVYYKDEEFLEAGAWLYRHFDDVSGISFLPYSEHTYKQAPYQEIDKETYEELVSKMPTIDWDKLSDFEKEDNTVAMQTLACVGGVCDL